MSTRFHGDLSEIELFTVTVAAVDHYDHYQLI